MRLLPAEPSDEILVARGLFAAVRRNARLLVFGLYLLVGGAWAGAVFVLFAELLSTPIVAGIGVVMIIAAVPAITFGLLSFTTGVMLVILETVRGPLDHPANHCRACGYNLTGNVSGICPECGERI